MSSAEFAEWQAYDRLEPFGPWRADLNAGIVASTIANVNRGKNRKAYAPKDFMPDWDPPDAPPKDLHGRLSTAIAAAEKKKRKIQKERA